MLRPLLFSLFFLHSTLGPVTGPSALTAQAAPGERLPVVTHTLANGMRFVILPRPTAPTVSFVVRYGVGGVNETPGQTGVAHLLEHMLFKGSTTVGTTNADAEADLLVRMDAVQDSVLALADADTPPTTAERDGLVRRIETLEDSARTFVVANEFDRILTRNGARGLNATTDNEATTYFVELPANRAQLWFVLESDRMTDPVFREFYTERDVVMEERRSRVDTNPGGRLYEAHLGAAFQVHPYGVPVVGYMADLEALTRAEVEDYYRRYYGPDNAVVSIVGAVDPDSMVAWADAYFGHLAPGTKPDPVAAMEPRQTTERRVQVAYDAEPQVRMGWHVGSAFDDDAPALTMLTYLLTGSRTGRLYRRLVTTERVATSVAASAGPGFAYPRLYSIQAVPRAPHTSDEVEEAVYEELDRLARTPPTEVELERVRRRLEASDVRRLASNLGLAFQLAESTARFDDWRRTFQLSARIARVTPADVQRVVGAYFTPENRTVATLVRPGQAREDRR